MLWCRRLFQAGSGGRFFGENLRNSGCVKGIKSFGWVENLVAQALVA